MGRVEDDVKFSWDNIPRTVTVSSFYMDETEVTNQYWLDYLHWLSLVYGDSYPEIVCKSTSRHFDVARENGIQRTICRILSTSPCLC
jgi:hypothetical protein